MKSYSTKKDIVIRKRIVKKKPSKRVVKQRKMLCERCKKRFDPDMILVHHKEHKRRSIPTKKTEGICVVDFDKYYSDHRKRPAHDRRDNLMMLCVGCYKKVSGKEGKTS